MLDSLPSAAEVKAAVIVLKGFRGKKTALDALIDRVTPRRLAHVVEEALRAVYLGYARKLWAETGESEALISAAIKWLNSSHFKKSPKP